MGREIRGEIWIWRLMAWLLCYVLCPALLQSNLKVTLWFLLPQSTGPLIHKLSLSYGILVYVCTNALDWNSFAILDLGGGRAINFADRCREDTIHRDMITILMRNDGSASGFGSSKKSRKKLVRCTNFGTTSITPLTQPSHLPPPAARMIFLYALVTNHIFLQNENATKAFNVQD